MSDVDIDFAEILRSPLDPDPSDPSRFPWGWAALLFLVGVAIGVALIVAVGDEAAADVALDTTAPAASPAAEVIETSEPFPEGYVPITTDVAVRAEAPVILGERMLVPVTMVLGREADAESVVRPLGGRWEMRTDQGVVASVGTVFDPFRPSVFSIEFPIVDPAPEAVVLVERWDAAAASATVELAWPGVPFVSETPISMELDDGASLVISELVLGNFLGSATWRLEGTDLGVVELDADLLDAAGELFDSYAGESGSLDADAGAGTIDFFWAPGFRVDQDEASTLRVTARAMLGTAVETEIEVPLP